ncbi:MAG: 50S ribosomal protein L30 [Methylococcales bacterium]|nr:50S ribosomal protein L30 [Methylococcaceae bacterium]
MTALKINITLVKSKYGRLPVHKDCLRGLGLKKINQTVQLIDTKEVRGLINKISYLLKVEVA